MSRRDEAGAAAEVIAWAIDIAAAAPKRPHAHTGLAQIPWPMITGLRSALDEAGADWRAVKAARDARVPS
jgi:hypothetical protein